MLKWFLNFCIILLIVSCDLSSKKINNKSTKVVAKSKKDITNKKENIKLEVSKKQIKKNNENFNQLAIQNETEQFNDLLDQATLLADDSIYMKTNTINLESFIANKTEKELLIFAKEIKRLAPFASKQLVEHLLNTITNRVIYVETVGLYKYLILMIGTENDFSKVNEVHEKLIEIYVNKYFM